MAEKTESTDPKSTTDLGGQKHSFVIPPDAVMMRPVRWVGKDDIKEYEAVEFLSNNPAASIDTYCRRLRVAGGIAKTESDTAGMCDLLDKNMDIIADFAVTKKGLAWLYKKLDTRVAV